MVGKKKIIFLHHVAGYMMIDIANAFAKEFEECTLLTGELRKRRKNLAPNIKLKKILAYNPSSNLSRLVTWIIGFIQALVYILLQSRDHYLFITTNPPLGVFIPLLSKKKYSLLIYDIYPDVLIKYKILSMDSILVKYWKRINRKVFDRAENIFTIGEGMKELVAEYIEPDRIKVVSCWTDSIFLKPVPRNENIFIQQQGVANKFLVMYSGNLGFTHSIETLVDLAEKADREDVFFFIIGEGDKWEMLSDRISKSELSNIRLLPWQDIEMLPYSLSAADLAVVTLGKEASLISVPSKFYDMMAVSSPVLCIAEKESEMAAIIERYKMGATFSSNETENMLDFIYKLIDNREFHEQLRNNSLRASMDFTEENACKFVHYK
jgi:glycosyltransferase involved in cell wall biosynthesis